MFILKVLYKQGLIDVRKGERRRSDWTERRVVVFFVV